MGNPPDFYEVLDIAKDASSQEIRRAYKALVKKWHPDKHPLSSKPEAEARFKAITQAYEALHDQQYRSVFGVYNEVGGGGGGEGGGSNRAPPSPGPRTGPFHQKKPISTMRDFKGVYYSMPPPPPVFPCSGSQRRKPPPVEKKLECTLEELCRGCKKEIKFTRDVSKDGLIAQTQETQTIRVKPGWKKGTKITFEGMGDERPGCFPADVVYLIAEKEHPIFKREGNDLVLKMEVHLVNALTGWTFSFRLITGEMTSCSFHEEIIHPGYEKVIQGHGMPVANEKGVRGDLRIQFSIIFPKKLSADQRKTIKEVLKDST